ncbi:RHS repeat-associated core domain-containing protein, partial [Pantoea sp. B65]|uniref:RHS repeat-associated core domain-containing protein n=1 Tax=Pantoea sp. B65 TaxID=2813359 RepID=UPI0039B37CF4
FAAYTRSYLYDRGGNLTRIRHSAPASGNNYTTDITVSTRSNRALISNLTAEPAQVEAFFTAGGQQTRLQPGQSLNWTARGELLQVTPVVRDGQPADHESYRYNSDSQRIIKTSVQKTGNSTQTRRALWLPRIELRSRYSGESLSEALQVISVGEAGRAQVRVLHWLTGKPDGISNNQLRYSYDNLVHSSELELDADGNIISQEEYYPYGGTAVWNARSQPEADYKAIRYAGKERDASGLYYYGYRYYQPWAGRWLSADPAGTVDGLNLFRMVRNNPLTLTDNNGKAPVYPASAEEKPTEVVSTSASMAQQPEGGVAGAGRQTIFPRLTSVVQTENIMNREFHYAIHQLSARFKLVTDVVAQGEQLIITAHADYAPWSGDVTIPPGVTVKFLNPHNSYLTDIDIRDVVLGADKTFVSVSSAGAEPATREAHALLAEGGLLPLTGSATPGKVRNYRLAKFRMDTIGMVAEALHASRNYASRGIALKSDFLLIRGRMDIRGIFINPTLQEIFDALEANNIKYTNIVAAFCRGGAFKPNKSFDPKRPA